MATINTGVAFGLWPEIPIWIVVAAFGILIMVAVKTRELWERVGLALVIVGGAMNTMQRIVNGGVIDNLRMWGLGYNNVADYLIFFGLVVYGYSYFVRRP